MPAAVPVVAAAVVPVVVAPVVAVPAVAAADDEVFALAVSSLRMSVTCTRKKASITGSSLDSRDVRVDCGRFELSDLPCSTGKDSGGSLVELRTQSYEYNIRLLSRNHNSLETLLFHF